MRLFQTSTLTTAGMLALLVTAGACDTPNRRAEVSIASGDVTLAGTILGPAGQERHPAMVFIHGSGPDGRDNEAYWIMADAFVKRGFVVLIYDKRGHGQSTGDWRAVPFHALFDDASAALAFLKRHPWVDSTRVGVWGGSEGAGIAPEVALRDTSVAFVIMQSVAGVKMFEQNTYQTTLQIAAATTDSSTRAALSHVMQSRLAYLRGSITWDEYDAARRPLMGGPFAGFAAPVERESWWWAWYRTKMDFTPIPALERVRAPVLAVWGGADVLVPVAASREAVTAARRRAGVRGDSLVVFEHANHSLHVNGIRSLARTTLKNRPVHIRLMAEWASRIVAAR